MLLLTAPCWETLASGEHVGQWCSWTTMKRWGLCMGCTSRWKQNLRSSEPIKRAELTAFQCLLGSDFALVAHNNASCATPGHDFTSLSVGQKSARISQATHATDLLQNHDISDSDATHFRDIQRPLERIEITILHALYNVLILDRSTSTVAVETSLGGTPCLSVTASDSDSFRTAGRHRQRRSPGSSHRRPHP